MTQMLPIIPLHRHYVRTCRACGTTWEVSRAAAAGGLGIGALLGQSRCNVRTARRAGYAAGAGVKAQLDAGTDHTLREAAQALRTCSRCGADDFDQHPRKKGRNLSRPPDVEDG